MNSVYYLTDTSFREARKVRPVARVVPDQTAVSVSVCGSGSDCCVSVCLCFRIRLLCQCLSVVPDQTAVSVSVERWRHKCDSYIRKVQLME
jgi:hypothetical protein